MALYSTFFSPFRTADALMMANARIASLEAELEASRKAWDVTTAAKAAAEKSTKSAATKAKKAEKALADAEQGRVQREQAITKCLNQISALAGGKYRVVLFLSACSFFDLLVFAYYPLSLSFVFPQRKLEYLWHRYSRMMKIL
jgi:septal ring factor EnvC (AmiA/AmiB activator)